MKHTKNQTNDTTANQSPKTNNYLLVKIALAGIISSLLLILLINLIFHVRLGTPIIDTNLKSAFGTLILFMPIFLLTREKEKNNHRKSDLNCLQENKNSSSIQKCKSKGTCTFVYISCLVSNLANRLASFLRSRL